MKLEDILITREKLKFITTPAHRVWVEDSTIYIERTKAPQFKGVVSILPEGFAIEIKEWAAEEPPIAKQTLLKNKALAFLKNFYSIVN
jgi:hypothetical protein